MFSHSNIIQNPGKSKREGKKKAVCWLFWFWLKFPQTSKHCLSSKIQNRKLFFDDSKNVSILFCTPHVKNFHCFWYILNYFSFKCFFFYFFTKFEELKISKEYACGRTLKCVTFYIQRNYTIKRKTMSQWEIHLVLLLYNNRSASILVNHKEWGQVFNLKKK